MENKNKFWKGVMLGVLITTFAGLVTVGASVGIYMFGRRVIDNQVEVRSERDPSGPAAEIGKETLDLERVAQKLGQIQKLVDSYYLFDEEADVEQEEAGIYMGYLYGLNDPYAAYYTKEQLASFMDETIGSYCGIGAMVSQNRQTGLITIIRVFADSPAAEAGMLPGDIIYAVDDEQVTGMDLTILVNNHIKGEENTTVKVTVFREEENDYEELHITRRIVNAETVTTEMLDKEVGYIAVTEFDTITAEQFVDGITKLENEGMKRLIIDLRNNPGGELEAVTSMMDYVIPDKKILVTVADKNGGKEEKVSKDGHFLDIPIVILVNGSSASASEVFTGALKDYEAATIVGTTTFGKGIVQSLYPLPDGSAVKLTMAHYYTPDGTDIHGKGIEPDVEVELNEGLEKLITIPKEEDNQLQEALRVIKEIE